MHRKAYVTDLDGTLLNSEQKLSAYTVQVITEAMEQGMIISFATARGFISADSVVADIPWRYPVILYNGALIYDSVARRVIDGYWLDPAISGEIITLGRAYGITPFHFCWMQQAVSGCCMKLLPGLVMWSSVIPGRMMCVSVR